MTGYAMLIYADEGIYYFNPLAAKTEEEAVNEALDYIDSGHTVSNNGDLHFKIIDVTNSHDYTTADYEEFFEQKNAEAMKRWKEQEEKLEREQFERLKKKFDKST